MRPRKLEMKGFTCFTDSVEIDFEGFDVFAITGRTGSGKTTIMDALCYALYGKVPRGTTAGSLMSRDAKHMHVALEFDAGEGRYRVTRGSNMPAKTATPFVQFERSAGDGQWEPLENRVKEAGAAIERVIGLDYAAFTRCILLPQGRFQEMLTGSREERRKVLEDLLDIGIYDRIRSVANARATDMNREAKLIQTILETTFAGATDEALAACKAELVETKPRLKTETERCDALMQASQHATAWKEIREGEQKRNEQMEKLCERLASAEQLAQTGEAELARRRDLLPPPRLRLRPQCMISLAIWRSSPLAGMPSRWRAARKKPRGHAPSQAIPRRSTVRARLPRRRPPPKRRRSWPQRRQTSRSMEARRADAAAHLRSGMKKGDACPVCGGTVGVLPKVQAPALAATESTAVSAKRRLDGARSTAANAQNAMAVAQQRAQHAVDAEKTAEAQLSAARAALAMHLPEGEPATVAALTARITELEQAERTRAAAAPRSTNDGTPLTTNNVRSLRPHRNGSSWRLDQRARRSCARRPCARRVVDGRDQGDRHPLEMGRCRRID